MEKLASLRSSPYLRKKIIDLWNRLKHDPDKLKLSIEDDPELKALGWNRIDNFLRKSNQRNVGDSISGRYWTSRLDADKLAKLKVMYTDPAIPIKEIAKEFGVSEKMIRNFGSNEGLSRLPLGMTKDALDAILKSYIETGDLAGLGIGRTYRSVRAKLPESSRDSFTRDDFQNRIEQLIWSDEMYQLLVKSIKDGLSPETFATYHTNIPLEIVRKRAKSLSGVSIKKKPVTFIPGHGRLNLGNATIDDETYELPRTSIDNPYPILLAEGATIGTIGHINGADLGLAFPKVISDNTTRRTLSYAEKNQDRAVVLTNIIDLDTQKASMGPHFIRRAFISGIDIDLGVLDPDYRERAKEILKGKSLDRVIYQTVAEKFESVMAGWSKVTHMKDGKPKFSGEVLIVLGKNEEDLIDRAAYEEIRYFAAVELRKVLAEIRVISQIIRKEEKDDFPDKKAAFKLNKLNKKLQSLQREAQRVIVSNTADEHRVKYARIVTSLVVKKIESVIPNSKVIGMGSAYVKIGDQIIWFVMSGHKRITDTLLSDFVSKSGPMIIDGMLPPVTVICHPYSLNYRYTVRQLSGTIDSDTVQIMTAPVAVDGVFLRKVLQNVISPAHPMHSLISKSQFEPGMLRLRYVDGYVYPEFNSIGAINPKIDSANVLVTPYRNTSYIWIMIQTDPHWGSRSKIFIWDAEKNVFLGVAEAAFQMMREGGLVGPNMPISLTSVNDDFSQGNHFGTHKNPSPHEQDITMISDKLQALITEADGKGDFQEAMRLMKEMRKYTINQFNLRGLDYLQNQILAVFNSHIAPSADVYSAVLARAQSSRLIVRGVSQFQRNVAFDNRDIGCICFGTGNHFERTIDTNTTEGIIFAQYLKAVLLQEPRWQSNRVFVESMVRAPLYSNQFFGWGTIQIPSGYEWGIALSSTPPRMSSWNDPLLGAERNDQQRGNSSIISSGRVTVKIYGDKHFHGHIHSGSKTIFVMGGAGTHTDQYGENGFPPNNSGVSFVGLPINGPDAGPVLHRSIRLDQLNKYFRDGKRQFNWDELLPNPA